jgi:hypothetical protein
VLPFLTINCPHLLYSVKMMFLFSFIHREFKVNKTANNTKCKTFLRVLFSFGEGHYTQ